MMSELLLTRLVTWGYPGGLREAYGSNYYLSFRPGSPEVIAWRNLLSTSMKFIIFLILIFNIPVQAQDKKLTTEVISKFGYSYSGMHVIEGGLILARVDRLKPHKLPPLLMSYAGVFLNAGYGFSKEESVFTTKAGFEYLNTCCYVGPIARIGIGNYTDFSQYLVTLQPEIGASVCFGIINITYGYNFRLAGDSFYNASGHSLNVNLILSLYDVTNKEYFPGG